MSFFTFRMSIICPLREVANRGVECELVARHAEAADRADRDIGEEGVMPEIFARRDVRQVQLDERNLHGEQRVAQRDARMGERGRIEQDEGNALVARRMDALDQVGLRVALKRVELVARRLRMSLELATRFRRAWSCHRAGLTAAELAEIRAIEQQKAGHGRGNLRDRFRRVYPVFDANGATIRDFADLNGSRSASDAPARLGDVDLARRESRRGAERFEVLGVQLAGMDAEDAAVGGREDGERQGKEIHPERCRGLPGLVLADQDG